MFESQGNVERDCVSEETLCLLHFALVIEARHSNDRGGEAVGGVRGVTVDCLCKRFVW